MFEFHGFQLNFESYTFMKALEKQIKENQKYYPEEGGERTRKWADKEIEAKIINVLKNTKIEDGAVTYLSLNRMRLPSLPDLPKTLITLYCGGNQLQSLPNLPENLIELACYNNQLITLSELPESMEHLNCSNNQLTSLPELPETLTRFFCSNNQLTSLPNLPENLIELACYNNPFPLEEISRIKQEREGKYLHI